MAVNAETSEKPGRNATCFSSRFSSSAAYFRVSGRAFFKKSLDDSSENMEESTNLALLPGIVRVKVPVSPSGDVAVVQISAKIDFFSLFNLFFGA